MVLESFRVNSFCSEEAFSGDQNSEKLFTPVAGAALRQEPHPRLSLRPIDLRPLSRPPRLYPENNPLRRNSSIRCCQVSSCLKCARGVVGRGLGGGSSVPSHRSTSILGLRPRNLHIFADSDMKQPPHLPANQPVGLLTFSS